VPINFSLLTTFREIRAQLLRAPAPLRVGDAALCLHETVVDLDDTLSNYYSPGSTVSFSFLPPPPVRLCAVLCSYDDFEQTVELLEDPNAALYDRLDQYRQREDAQLFCFRADGAALPADISAAEASQQSLIVLSFSGILDEGIASEAGSRRISRNLQPNVDGDLPNLFESYVAYFRAGGRKSGKILECVRKFLRHPPIVAAFEKLIRREALRAADLFVVRESLRAYLQKLTKRRLFDEALGHLFSNWLGNRESVAASAGVLSAVPADLARRRRSMAVVVDAARRAHLQLAVGIGGRQYLLGSGAAPPSPAGAADARAACTVVVVDGSGSMRCAIPRFRARPRRKALAAAAIAAAFFEAAWRLGAPGAYALAPGPPLRVPPAACGPAPAGRVWPAIGAAAAQIAARKRGAPGRILVLTDGEEEPPDGALALGQALCADRIVLDAVVLGERAVAPALFALVRITGGTIARPASLADACAFVQREEFVDLALRHLPDRANARLRMADLSAWGRMMTVFDTEGPRVSRPFRQADLLGECALPPDDPRKERCGEELRRCRWRNFSVYAVIDPSVCLWRAFVEIASAGKGVFWDIAVVFPADYPYAPPTLRFVSIPENLACDAVSPTSGRIITESLARYHDKMHVVAFLTEIAMLNFEGTPINREDLLGRPLPGDRPTPLPDLEYLALLNFENPVPSPAGPVPRGIPSPVFSQITGRRLSPEDRSPNTDIVIHRDEEVLLEETDRSH
jgi:hypothetical protein